MTDVSAEESFPATNGNDDGHETLCRLGQVCRETTSGEHKFFVNVTLIDNPVCCSECGEACTCFLIRHVRTERDDAWLTALVEVCETDQHPEDIGSRIIFHVGAMKHTQRTPEQFFARASSLELRPEWGSSFPEEEGPPWKYAVGQKVMINRLVRPGVILALPGSSEYFPDCYLVSVRGADGEETSQRLNRADELTEVEDDK